MKFVKGSPIRGFNNTHWYLHLKGNEARDFVWRLLQDNAVKFLADPHATNDYASGLAAKASTQLAERVLLGERDGYYVNQKGGMCPELYGICHTKDTDNFPGTPKLKVSRWQKGTHFYAKVNGLDVVDTKGRYKWGTEADAKRAAKRFAKRNDIVL